MMISSVAPFSALAPPIARRAPVLTPLTPTPTRTWEISASLSISYSVQLCSDLLDPRNPALAEAGTANSRDSRRRFVVVDDGVDLLYGSRIRRYFDARSIEARVVTFHACEERKTIDTVLELVGLLDGFELDRRREPLIAIGGGVVRHRRAISQHVPPQHALRARSHGAHGGSSTRASGSRPASTTAVTRTAWAPITLLSTHCWTRASSARLTGATSPTGWPR